MIMVPMNSRMDKSMDSHYYILVYVTLGTEASCPFSLKQTKKEKQKRINVEYNRRLHRRHFYEIERID